MSLFRKYLKAVCVLVVLGAVPTLAGACPNPDAAANSMLSETGVGLRWGSSVRVLAGGEATLESCPQVEIAHETSAHFSTQPALELSLAGMIGLGIELKPVRGCAREFLILSSDGNWYHRGPGLNGMVPPVVLSAVRDGPVRLWIGTAPGDQCRMRIQVSTVAAR
ncbi:hypothetical protein EU805_06620 [Salipiger sp. IMCC34102]|uniref:hypothetical protein n=1 Tax=Salipiger sp. IMCC34102 TaxID=2510647 RepID=UPI00101E0F5D|nr:hypothetical protein [Salipiger sp. IMCC34102]RYH03392.1 hypothetical protein EU805_06620 [Salipiger sp. IMCC34102]